MINTDANTNADATFRLFVTFRQNLEAGVSVVIGRHKRHGGRRCDVGSDDVAADDNVSDQVVC